MKRDMDLIRTILLKVETDPIFDGSPKRITQATLGTDKHSDQEIAYNCAQLIDADFLTGNAKKADIGLVIVGKLTWKGHDFLDSVRDPKIWEKTKKGAEGAGGFTVELLKDLAKGLVKKQIEEYTGVKL